MKITRLPLLQLLGIFMLSGLAACAQTTEDTAAADTVAADTVATDTASTPVNVFPARFFEPGYTESYVITGSDQEARVYSGTFELATSEETIFNGVPAIPVSSTLSYSRPINGVVVPPMIIVLTEYFSATTPRKYLGSVNNDTAVIMTPVTVPVEIPEVVNAEGSGKVGDLTGTDTSAESISWSINKLDNNIYQLSYFSEVTNSAGDIINSEAQTFNIDATGERQAWAFDSVLPGGGIAFSFTGTRI
jgi:hypothetical protein